MALKTPKRRTRHDSLYDGETGGPPTHKVKLTLKSNKSIYTIVAVAWVQPSGYFNFQLRPGVTLNWRELQSGTHWLTMFPFDKPDNADPEGHYEEEDEDDAPPRRSSRQMKNRYPRD